MGKEFTLKLLKKSEAQIENEILSWLYLEMKIMAWKNHTGGYYDAGIKRFRRQTSPHARKGAPDILCIVAGRFVGLEVKSETGTQSKDQKIFMEDVRKAKGYYFLVRSLEDARRAIQWVLAEIEDGEPLPL